MKGAMRFNMPLISGAEAVSQIITFGTMAAQAAVMAWVQGKPYGLADIASDP